ncbi:MAG: hypothetical protein ACR2PH_10160, partial [Desulfobulbia bacterium]
MNSFDHSNTVETGSIDRKLFQFKQNKRKFAISRQIFSGCIAILDILSLSVPAIAMYLIYVAPVAQMDPLRYFAAITLLTTFTLLLLAYGGLYQCIRITRPFRYLPRVISLVSISFLLLIALGFLLKLSTDFSRVWLVSWASMSIGLVSLCRIMVPKIMRNLARKGQLTRNILVFGAGQQGADLVHRIQQSKEPWT